MNKHAPARVNPLLVHAQEQRRSLQGTWRFRLDPDDRGLDEEWFRKSEIIQDPIEVPGSWQGQGFGGDGTDIPWDFRIAVRTFRATYSGTGWYAKSFQLPDDWRGRRVSLAFGGVFPSARVWLNGGFLGAHGDPFVPFSFDISDILGFGGGNDLVVQVFEENRELGLTFSWLGNWSGLYRSVDLTAAGECCLDRFCLYPDVDTEKLKISVRTGEAGKRRRSVEIEVKDLNSGKSVASQSFSLKGDGGEFEVRIPGPLLWSPDTPNLYRVDGALVTDNGVSDAVSFRVGFLKLSTRGKHFCINGDPYYMRGTGEFISNPETGCPDTHRGRWRKKLKALRDYGYNYVRCQSFVPTPEYFDAADELGILVQSEMGMLGGWGGHSPWHVYQWPKPIPRYREALRRQWNAVVLRDVNHPSANLYCMSNELGGDTVYPRVAWKCYHETKQLKPTALVIWTDGGLNEELPGDFVNAVTGRFPETGKPQIEHEFKWWSSFPDVRTAGKYTGAMRPWSIELARSAAASRGTQHVLVEAAENSQRLQFIEAKMKMERCRRDNAILAGICHFSAMDTTPSPQGIIDEFYDKKYASGELWRQTNGDTVVLSSLGFDDRVVVGGERLRAALFLSDFSHPPLENPEITWKMIVDEEILDTGTISCSHEPFRTCRVGELETSVPSVEHPVTGCLKAAAGDRDREFRNDWSFWLFPGQSELPEGLAVYGTPELTWLTGGVGLAPVEEGELSAGKVRFLLTEKLTGEVGSFIRDGGRALLAAGEGHTRRFTPKFRFTEGWYYFTPPAQYPPYVDGQNGTIIRNHPMLGDFPHEGFADLQFFRVMEKAPPLELEPLGLDGEDPVIRVIHTYQVGASLGHLVEVRFGKGSLVICSLDLDQTLPEARYLLGCICRYGTEDEIATSSSLDEPAFETIAEASALGV